MENPNDQRKIDEAIRTGQRARDSLLQAKDFFSNAGNCGLLDLFGFVWPLNTIVTCYKMKDAEQPVQQARSDLMQFGKELTDADTIAEFHVETGDFQTFADDFLDWIPMDWLGQTRSRIWDAEREVDDAIEKVEKILRQLEGL